MNKSHPQQNHNNSHYKMNKVVRSYKKKHKEVNSIKIFIIMIMISNSKNITLMVYKYGVRIATIVENRIMYRRRNKYNILDYLKVFHYMINKTMSLRLDSRIAITTITIKHID